MYQKFRLVLPLFRQLKTILFLSLPLPLLFPLPFFPSPSYVLLSLSFSISLSPVRNDLLMVCRQLNMEGSVAEIMGQLGADERGKISFEDFTRCRMQLVNEIRKEEGEISQCSQDSDTRKLREHIASWPTSSEISRGEFGDRQSRLARILSYIVKQETPINHSCLQA